MEAVSIFETLVVLVRLQWHNLEYKLFELLLTKRQYTTYE
jgi:hypothetical protein